MEIIHSLPNGIRLSPCWFEPGHVSSSGVCHQEERDTSHRGFVFCVNPGIGNTKVQKTQPVPNRQYEEEINIFVSYVLEGFVQTTTLPSEEF